jgi:micrococcal nuclease
VTTTRWIKRALLASALFVCGLVLPAAQPVACPIGHVDVHATVRYVFDGDTVMLTNGERVRFIGMDAPEVSHQGRPAQPYADAATRALKQLLSRSNDRLLIEYGTQRRDHYGRLLAYLYLPDHTDLTETLLRDGFATALTIPPNTRHYRCYQAAETAARRQRRGIWSLPRYQPTPSTAVGDRAKGFHIVTGRVEHVGHSRKSVWLDLPGRVAVRIPRKDLPYFKNINLDQLRGRRIEIRGWIHHHRGEKQIEVRHPAALSLLDE